VLGALQRRRSTAAQHVGAVQQCIAVNSSAHQCTAAQWCIVVHCACSTVAAGRQCGARVGVVTSLLLFAFSSAFRNFAALRAVCSSGVVHGCVQQCGALQCCSVHSCAQHAHLNTVLVFELCSVSDAGFCFWWPVGLPSTALRFALLRPCVPCPCLRVLTQSATIPATATTLCVVLSAASPSDCWRWIGQAIRTHTINCWGIYLCCFSAAGSSADRNYRLSP